jgi:hypothetical protein
MAKVKNATILVKGTEIAVIKAYESDYISLTDMVKYFENGTDLIEKWLRNKNTIEFLGIWEKINNSGFNSPEFEGIMKEAGLNRFSLSVKKWVGRTGAIGLLAKAGRFGNGTFAQKDIAFEFGSWLSAEFKLYLRDFASLEQLVVPSNLESLNAVLIHQQLPQEERIVQLNRVAIIQMRSLLGNGQLKRLKKQGSQVLNN